MLNISGKIYVHYVIDGDVQIKGLAVSVLGMIMSHTLLCYIRLDFVKSCFGLHFEHCSMSCVIAMAEMREDNFFASIMWL